MTMFEDKLNQAGADTLGAQFYARATEALKASKTTRDAWRILGDKWGLATLTRIQNDMQNRKSGDQPVLDTHSENVSRESGGQSNGDTQRSRAAALTQSRSEGPVSPGYALQGGGSQGQPDTHASSAAASTSPKPKAFFRQTPKTDTAKRITRSAMLAGSSLWAEFKIERLRYREGAAFMREQIIAGGNTALKAKWHTQRAAFVWLALQHGKPTDENAFLKDCITAKEAAKFASIADSQAALIVSKLVQQTAREIESGVKLIAAE